MSSALVGPSGIQERKESIIQEEIVQEQPVPLPDQPIGKHHIKQHLDSLLENFNPQAFLKNNAGNYYLFKTDFVNFALPLLTNYADGNGLSELERSHPWLSDMADSSKRHEAARSFYQNPTQNIALLEKFVKLWFCRNFGSELMGHSVACCVIHELYKLVIARSEDTSSSLQTKVQAVKREGQEILEPVFTTAFRNAEAVTGNSKNSEELPDKDSQSELEQEHNVQEKTLIQNDFMLDLYGEAWKKFLERESNDKPSYTTPDSNLEHWPSRWYYLLSKTNTRRQDFRWAVKRFLEQEKSGMGFAQKPNDDQNGLKFPIESSQLIKLCQGVEKELDLSQNLSYLSAVDCLRDTAWGAWLKCIANRLAQWKRSINEVRLFCIDLGCPEASSSSDPFENIQHLRKMLSRHFTYTADLHNRISELNRQQIQQQRMITALAYRNVLESLIKEQPEGTESERYIGFLDARIFGEQSEQKIRDLNHPLAGFLKRYFTEKAYSRSFVRKMTDNLYSSLSRTIHNFQPSKKYDQYTILEGQFDPMEISFLLALKPLKENVGDDGNVDWEKERKRYPKPIKLWSTSESSDDVDKDLPEPTRNSLKLLESKSLDNKPSETDTDESIEFEKLEDGNTEEAKAYRRELRKEGKMQAKKKQEERLKSVEEKENRRKAQMERRKQLIQGRNEKKGQPEGDKDENEKHESSSNS